MAKKFKDTKLHNMLRLKLPKLANMVSDVLPDSGVLGIIKNVIHKDKTVSDDETLELLNEVDILTAEMEAETKKIRAVTELEKTQLNQEDLITKRARPIRQYSWILLLFLCYPLAYLIKGSILELPEILLIGMFTDMGLYTSMRTLEKSGLPIKSLINKLFKKT